MKKRHRPIRINGPVITAEELLRAELNQLREAFIKIDVQRALFVQMLTAILHADYDNTRVITIEELAAAEQECGFQFAVHQVKRSDNRVDHKLVLVQLPPAGDAEDSKAIPEGPRLVT